MKNNILVKIGTIVLLSFIVLAVFAPLFTSFDHSQTELLNTLGPPSLTHILGTDELGRDIFSRMLYGGRISLFVGLIAVFISISIGTIIGSISGYSGGRIDYLIMRFVDFLLALPIIFIILALQVIFKPSIINIMVVIGITSWMGVARLVRGEFLKIKNFTYVKTAKAYGISRKRIIFKKILPNAIGPIVVAATLGMAGAILTESILSYLGLGVQPPYPSWGNMLQSGQEYMLDAPWLVLVPGLSIFFTVLSLNFIGEGLREKFE